MVSPKSKKIGIADCVNDNVVEMQGAWQHNGCGLQNDAEFLRRLVLTRSPCKSLFFHYEAYAQEPAFNGWILAAEGWQLRSRVDSTAVDNQASQLPLRSDR